VTTSSRPSRSWWPSRSARRSCSRATAARSSPSSCRRRPGKKAGIFADKIRRIVDSTPFVYESKEVKVTISLGLATMGKHRETLAFIKAADEMLYLAKNNGRNRVEGIPDEP
jgi:GGDEF domain-containing protein